jgi:hypothetical protein
MHYIISQTCFFLKQKKFSTQTKKISHFSKKKNSQTQTSQKMNVMILVKFRISVNTYT